MCISYPIEKFKSNSEGGILIDTQKGIYDCREDGKEKRLTVFVSPGIFFKC